LKNRIAYRKALDKFLDDHHDKFDPSAD